MKTVTARKTRKTSTKSKLAAQPVVIERVQTTRKDAAAFLAELRAEASKTWKAGDRTIALGMCHFRVAMSLMFANLK